jgi:hypothetical protein
MAPTNRIVTLDDIDRGPNDWNVKRNETDENDLYCQPVGQGSPPPGGPVKGPIPLYVIPHLPKSEECLAILARIHDEFFPIVQKRGYNVVSISELCCCGDGLDHEQQQQQQHDREAASQRSGTSSSTLSTTSRNHRKSRKMGDNVLGYNQTTFAGGKRFKSHAIHLRLRDSRDHRRIFDWEEIAGTMAHELSHCVHQNHGGAFFKLMEAILEEHAVLQTQRLSSFSGLEASSTMAQTDKAPFPTAAEAQGQLFADAGHKLGGSSFGTSRLVGERPRAAAAGGVRLGGAAKTSAGVRELAARAAELRQRQLLQIKRAIERSREPCVIEIFDDDDETDGSDENNENKTKNTLPASHAASGSDKKIRSSRGKRSHSSGERNQAGASNQRPRASNEPFSSRVIDLTASHKHPTASREPSSSSSSSSSQTVIDLTALQQSPSAIHKHNDDDWSCGRCTYRNRASDDRCAMCRGCR